MSRPGCSLCHPSLCFSHSVDGHLSTLPRERQWFLSAWVNTQQSNISNVSNEKRPISWDFSYWSDVVVYIGSDSSASVMELRLVGLIRKTQTLLKPPVIAWILGFMSSLIIPFKIADLSEMEVKSAHDVIPSVLRSMARQTRSAVHQQQCNCTDFTVSWIYCAGGYDKNTSVKKIKTFQTSPFFFILHTMASQFVGIDLQTTHIVWCNVVHLQCRKSEFRIKRPSVF